MRAEGRQAAFPRASRAAAACVRPGSARQSEAMTPCRRSTWRAFGLAVAAAALAQPLSAQGAPAFRSETVFYRNAEDSTYLTAELTLPSGAGPHAGVVLLSIAGTQTLVGRLAGLGYAVLLPTRRGFVEVEPLLRATYQDLAGDARAAVDYLRARPDVDDARLSLIGQGDDSPPAMLAAAGLPQPIPLILLAPPGFPGREVFQLEQRAIAENEGRTPQELTALDRYLG